jgi:hypothetical protein
MKNILYQNQDRDSSPPIDTLSDSTTTYSTTDFTTDDTSFDNCTISVLTLDCSNRPDYLDRGGQAITIKIQNCVNTPINVLKSVNETI